MCTTKAYQDRTHAVGASDTKTGTSLNSYYYWRYSCCHLIDTFFCAHQRLRQAPQAFYRGNLLGDCCIRNSSSSINSVSFLSSDQMHQYSGKNITRPGNYYTHHLSQRRPSDVYRDDLSCRKQRVYSSSPKSAPQDRQSVGSLWTARLHGQYRSMQ